MLSPYRVLDLTDDKGLLCGQILADLGADVVQVEPPGGNPARKLAPFAKQQHESLVWWAYARNKRSLCLDLTSQSDHGILLNLVRHADILIESEQPGAMAELNLDYRQLQQVNPALIYVSITAFGQSGPKSGYRATDLTVLAASSYLYLSGEAEQQPVRLSVPQAYLHACADGVIGALIALFERHKSGLGQQIDVSAQQSMTLATLNRSLDKPAGQPKARRSVGGFRLGELVVRTEYQAKDGWVFVSPGLMSTVSAFMQRLMQWAYEEGQCDKSLLQTEWKTLGRRLVSGEEDAGVWMAVDRAIEGLIAPRTKVELMQIAVERKLLLAPAFSLAEIIQSEHMHQRQFLMEQPHPGSGSGGTAAGTVTYPGPFAKFSASAIVYRKPPPKLNEQGEQVISEWSARPPPSSPVGAVDDPLPLSEIKVLDLFWVVAGPGSTRMLADYGATVVHVESSQHHDTLRYVPPYIGGDADPENALGFQNTNAGKLNITLDLGEEDGRQVLRDLVAWADVVTESFAAGVVERMGFGYEANRKIKGDIIMISSCLMGQTGPYRNFAGFGNLAAAVSGFQQLGGLPDRVPTGSFGPYTDFIAMRYNAVAILAALEHRRRTGEGQHIDLSQTEAGLHFVAPAFLDYTVNGSNRSGQGNRDLNMAPHNVYAARGEDRWVAIAIQTDADWRALCDLLELVDFSADAELDHLSGRQSRSAEIDAAISAWTTPRDAGEIERLLQSSGIAAHAVLDTEDLFADEQLRQRNHYLTISHPIHKTITIEASRSKLSRTPARIPSAGLTFGSHNRFVLSSILGYSQQRISELETSGVLQ